MMEPINWLGELQKKYPVEVEDNEGNVKRGRPVGSKNKVKKEDTKYLKEAIMLPPTKDMTKEQWRAAYWKLRRQYRKECLNLK